MDYEGISRTVSKFIQDMVSQTGRDGIVFGLSGGIDSAVISYLCKNALGSEKCCAIILPHGEITPDDETNDAVKVAQQLGIRYHICEIKPIVDEFKKISGLNADKVSVGNLLARTRAMMIYYYANVENYLTCGTDDKSEYLIGYFTKYGDGASDILPIRELYKTEVQKLGEHLGVPSNIVKKQPGAHLWKDHTAQNEIGAGYDTIDVVLSAFFDKKMEPAEIANKFGIERQVIDSVISMHEKSGHKRNLQPFCDLSDFK